VLFLVFGASGSGKSLALTIVGAANDG